MTENSQSSQLTPSNALQEKKARVLALIEGAGTDGSYDEAQFDALMEALKELCSMTPTPCPLDDQAFVAGPWRTLFASFGPRHTAGKTLVHDTLLSFQSFNKFPKVPVRVLALEQEIHAGTFEYNNIAYLSNTSGDAKASVITRGVYDDSSENRQRYNVNFQRVELVSDDGLDDEALRKAFDLPGDHPLAVDLSANFHSDISFCDDTMRVNYGSVGGVYVLERLDHSGRSVELFLIMALYARKTEIMWASGSLATGSVYNAMALFSLFYLTQVVGISPAIAGSLLLFTKIYDAVTDPIMGAISDRTRHSAGRRRPYLLLGCLLLGGSFALFFNTPDLTGASLLVVVTLLLLLQSTGYTVFGVPYLAMAPDIAQSYDDRTRLMSLRVAFLIVGVMLGSVGGPYIVGMAADSRDGYGLLGVTLGAFVVVCGFLAYKGTAGVLSDDPNAISTARESSVLSSLNDMVSVFSYQPFRVLTLVKLLQLVVLALALACTPYFFQYVLQRPPSDIGAYLMTFSLTGLASVAAWRVVIARYGKREVYMWSILGYGVGLCTWWLWTPAEAEVFFYARAAGLGILSNGTLLCALALLPDTMEFDRLASGRNREGVMSGVFTTVEKVSGALGPFVIGIMLQTTGLIAGRGVVAEQPAEALTAIHLGVSIVPAILCFAAIPLLLRYNLGPKKLKEMREARDAAGVEPISAN